MKSCLQATSHSTELSTTLMLWMVANWTSY